MNTSTQASGEAFLKSIESLPWVQYHGQIARSRSVAYGQSHSGSMVSRANSGSVSV
ncbi:hypothetical protein [Moorena sp. SIO3H5]|uniref:hypothetical protein n=1 Tax=Moorena sp. SIO3H5 TaxID=2607834 RepID=UPI0025ED8CE5|nr:hypothetical protein [Moorena sp. SIO3H5]